MSHSTVNPDMRYLSEGNTAMLDALNELYDAFEVTHWDGLDPMWANGVPSLARAIAATYFDEVSTAMEMDEPQWATHVASYLSMPGIVAGALYLTKHADEFGERSFERLTMSSCDRATSDAVTHLARFVGASKMLRGLAETLVEEFSEHLAKAREFDDDVFRSIMSRVHDVYDEDDMNDYFDNDVDMLFENDTDSFDEDYTEDDVDALIHPRDEVVR